MKYIALFLITSWLSDKKFPSTNVELLEKEFKKNVLKED